jgi:hypothetical protein
MGQDWWPNKATPIKLLILVLETANLKIQEDTFLLQTDHWISFHTYLVICYVLSLCGCDDYFCDLERLDQKFGTSRTPYVAIALLGKIKGESGDRAHLIPCVHVASAGIEVKASVECLIITFKARQCFIMGPVISDLHGGILSHCSLNSSLWIFWRIFLTCIKNYSHRQLQTGRRCTSGFKSTGPWAAHQTPELLIRRLERMTSML